MEDVSEIRNRDWGNGVVGREAQALTDGMLRHLGSQLQLDEHGMALLESTIREHTVRVAEASQRAVAENKHLAAVSDDEPDATILEFPRH